MAQIKIVTVGKLKEAYFSQAQAEYIKRLRPYLKLDLWEVPDQPCPDGASSVLEDQVRGKEGSAIRNLLQPKDYIVALDRQGKEMSSPELAAFLQDKIDRGVPLVFIIGGSLGLPEDLLREAQLKWSFSRLTFPHQLFRVMLLEQIYRACKINRGEPYHK